MTLLPVYPPKSASGADVTLICSCCKETCLSSESYAVLEKPFNYVCRKCADEYPS